MANELRYGDRIHLQNLFQGDGGLPRRQRRRQRRPAEQRRHSRRLHGLGPGPGQQQQPLADLRRHRLPQDGLVRINDTVQLWNTYANRGGFLETNGSSSAGGARYDVDTNTYSNRGNTSVTFWTILPAT
ncbi:hypothetical protein C3492_36700 [Streptomyces sp. Ru62]|uniref:hypothetical protein n=1 Tax=Streptomyces sp. Ru62 TaxID=2080745 RepID=UPI000CDE49DA|nr:hypothetical protein [Streptomyces sp. Ru62]POX58602.1 hypothetical protein C3492_36700 [Streptomyces sp. Ru62]